MLYLAMASNAGIPARDYRHQTRHQAAAFPQNCWTCQAPSLYHINAARQIPHELQKCITALMSSDQVMSGHGCPDDICSAHIAFHIVMVPCSTVYLYAMRFTRVPNRLQPSLPARQAAAFESLTALSVAAVSDICQGCISWNN